MRLWTGYCGSSEEGIESCLQKPENVFKKYRVQEFYLDFLVLKFQFLELG